MITVISPAKTLDLETKVESEIKSYPKFNAEPERLIKKLKTLSRKKISNLMSLSEKLSDLNYQRYQMWSPEPSEEMVKQAVLMFKGDVYQGLEAETFTDEEYHKAQENLRILSGLYGYLKPMDLIQAYRLEMGTKLPVARKKNLYEFWGDKIAKEINNELEGHKQKYLINLASNEYFKAANERKIKYPIITPVFKDAKNGNYKVISFFAKRARGVMARWIIQNKIEEPEKLKLFDQDGYYYNDLLSSDKEIVFTREEMQ
ncbi:peroxide stress protein YaaA [bacterium SCSIO 12643]|nr:peroxide stress protein YaaA [bacterium SCSIO 12643]